MELLSLFDTPVIETEPVQEFIVPAPEVIVTRELDYELLQDIERFQFSKTALTHEINFLVQYCERFGFQRDRLRLETLQYYLEQQG